MITLIGACGLNREIGKDNQLLWNLPNDLKFFKQQTEGKTVVVGRLTQESILTQLGRPLPNRSTIVLSSNENYKMEYENCKIAHSVKDVLDANEELFICGGQQIYEAFLPYADRILLTIVDHKFPEADSFFPEISYDWIVESSVQNKADEKHAYDYYFVTYRKKKDLLPKRK